LTHCFIERRILWDPCLHVLDVVEYRRAAVAWLDQKHFKAWGEDSEFLGETFNSA
jgi:hypothetical protein